MYNYEAANCILISALVISMVEGFTDHEAYAQKNTSNGNMTSAMVMLALLQNCSSAAV
jgi:hypothetical protein